MNPFENNAFDYSALGKAFAVPLDTFNPGLAVMQGYAAAAARAGLEIAGFWSRRARAGLDAPRRYSACRTFQDLASTQSELAMAAMRDAAETTERTWMILSTPLGGSAAAGNGEGRNPAQHAEHPGGAPAYEWWRTDMKAIMPRRNGHAVGAELGRLPA